LRGAVIREPVLGVVQTRVTVFPES
jgi:hypothetical protein